MGWVRVSDDFYDHPKFTDMSPLALSLWITGVAFCNRNRTDGYISERAAVRLVDFDGISYTVATVGDLASIGEDNCYPFARDELIRVGLWHEEGHDCPACPQPGRRKLYVHDYLAYQPSADEIKERAVKRSEAGRKGAESRWGGA